MADTKPSEIDTEVVQLAEIMASLKQKPLTETEDQLLQLVVLLMKRITDTNNKLNSLGKMTLNLANNQDVILKFLEKEFGIQTQKEPDNG